MTYKKIVDWLYNQLPVYQRDGIFKYKLDLSAITSVCDYLDNPQLNFRSVHVAGTNGKGSSSHMLSSVFQEAGLKVGLYTSPHLLDFRERIKINGRKIKKNDVVKFVIDNKSFFEENKISFFEMTVAMAFDYFSKSNVDLAIIETGMGGRLDATNIIKPILSLITNVGLDHQQYLGQSLREIAIEKAGIIKKNIPVVVSEYQKEIEDIFVGKAEKLSTKIYYAGKQKICKKTDLKGNYQLKNLNGVIECFSKLKQFNISEDNIKIGLNNIKKNTGLKGRWETYSKNPLTIMDVGHNYDAFKYIIVELSKINFNKLIVILGFTKGKDYKKILNEFPKFTSFYFCELKLDRSENMGKIYNYALSNKMDCKYFDSIDQGYKKALENSIKNDLIFVGGSNFAISEFLKINV